MVRKPDKHERGKQRCQDLGCKVHDRAKSFVLRSYTMHELRFYWLVPQYGVNHYCVLCTVKAKTANKNLQQRTLSGFITILLHQLWPSGWCMVLLDRESDRPSWRFTHFRISINLGNKALLNYLCTGRKAGKRKRYSLRVCNNLSMAVFIIGWPICSGSIPSISMTLQNNAKRY